MASNGVLTRLIKQNMPKQTQGESSALSNISSQVINNLPSIKDGEFHNTPSNNNDNANSVATTPAGLVDLAEKSDLPKVEIDKLPDINTDQNADEQQNDNSGLSLSIKTRNQIEQDVAKRLNNDPDYLWTNSDYLSISQLPIDQQDQIVHRDIASKAMVENPVNDEYMDYFVSQGYDPNANTSTVFTDIAKNVPEIMSGIARNDMTGDEIGAKIDEIVTDARTKGIDDGTMDKENLSSNWMTGDQYIKYIEEVGSGGRNPNEINPYAIYSKFDEYRDHGFNPYAADESEYGRLYGDSGLSYISRAQNELANIRSNLSDYSIDIGNKKISGSDFDKKADTYLSNMVWRYPNGFPEGGYQYDSSNDQYQGLKAKTLTGWTVIDDDGTSINIDGDASIIKSPTQEDQTIDVVLGNGDVYRFDDIDRLNEELVPIESDANDGDIISSWVPQDLVMDDGQTLSYQEVSKIRSDDPSDDNRDGSIGYDFGIANMGKPVRFLNPDNGNIIDTVADYIPSNIDMIAGSIPYLFPMRSGIPFIAAAGNAMMSTAGVDPRSITMDGVGLKSNTDNNTDYVTKALANLALAPQERIIGRFARGGLGQLSNKATESLAGKIGSRAWMPFVNWELDNVLEGIEEVAADPVETLSQYGWNGLYANDLIDENGNVVYDDSGRPVPDYDTSIPDRAMNALDSFKDSFLAGHAFGFDMGLKDLPSTYKSAQDIYSVNRADKSKGLDVYRDVKEQNNASKFLMPEDAWNIFDDADERYR